MTDPVTFAIDAVADGEATELVVTSGDVRRAYRIAGGEQADYTAFYETVAADFGTRPPHHVEHPLPAPSGPQWTPLITDNLSPRILCGYGDPAVLRTEDALESRRPS